MVEWKVTLTGRGVVKSVPLPGCGVAETVVTLPRCGVTESEVTLPGCGVTV